MAVVQVEKLKIELNESKQWSAIGCMEIACHGQKFDWRKLKEAETSAQRQTPCYRKPAMPSLQPLALATLSGFPTMNLEAARKKGLA